VVNHNKTKPLASELAWTTYCWSKI